MGYKQSNGKMELMMEGWSDGTGGTELYQVWDWG